MGQARDFQGTLLEPDAIQGVRTCEGVGDEDILLRADDAKLISGGIVLGFSDRLPRDADFRGGGPATTTPLSSATTK